MFDCANVEIRELLPELAAGTLDAPTRARVEAHVAMCTECASEVETLRLVRAAFASAPVVDTRRILAALPKPNTLVTAPARLHAARRRWADWRVAAALTMMTVGGLSVVVSQRISQGGEDVRTPPPSRAETTVVAYPPVVPSVDAPTALTPRASPGAPPATVRAEKAELSFGVGVDDLDPASLKALMSALDEIERSPVAPSAEPGRVTVLPVISDDTR